MSKIRVDDDHSDYVIRLHGGENKPESPNECNEGAKSRTIERKATKKRIKLLRWLKETVLDKGHDDVTVIGDIYKIDDEGNRVKLWCLLRDRQLCCYTCVTDTTPNFVLPLDKCIAVPCPVTSDKKYAFDIEKEGVKVATFVARSSKERGRWIEIVKNKRGTILLANLGEESEEEAEGSGTSEEDDEGYEYVTGRFDPAEV